MNPGELKHKISIYAQESSANKYGGTSAVEVLIAETWAKKEPVKTNNQYAIEAGASVLNEDVIFTVRWRKDFKVSKDAVIKSGTENYTVLAVINMNAENKWFRIVGARTP